MSVTVVTLGCRLNLVESEAMKAAASAQGLSDIVIVNTCAVTAEAVRQARQTIRKIKRDTPHKQIIVTGCAAQIEPERFAALDDVHLVLGNDVKSKPELWADIALQIHKDLPAYPRVQVADIMAVTDQAPHFVSAFSENTRAFVEVQNGCDHRCTFCIIPYGRGRSRSVPMGDVVDQIKRLTESGHREVVLTGVDLTSYGPDLPGAPRLGRLVQSILKHVPDLHRLRLSSIDSVEADEELIEVITHERRLMPHLHLSLQSGDDLILKRMKRRHLRDDAIRFCTDMKRARPDIVFGADLIAGFPTESDEAFENTRRLIDDCGLTFLHIFPYSPRQGTPAAKMPQVESAIIKERAKKLRERGEDVLSHHLTKLVGTEQEILVERGGLARTRCFTPVHVGDRFIPGDLVTVTITHHDGKRLIVT